MTPSDAQFQVIMALISDIQRQQDLTFQAIQLLIPDARLSPEVVQQMTGIADALQEQRANTSWRISAILHQAGIPLQSAPAQTPGPETPR